MLFIHLFTYLCTPLLTCSYICLLSARHCARLLRYISGQLRQKLVDNSVKKVMGLPWRSSCKDCTAGGLVQSLMGKLRGFPCGSVVKNLPANAGDTGDGGLLPGLGRSPGDGSEWKPTPVFFPGKFHGQRSLTVYSSWGRKESDTTEQLTLSLFTCIV